MFKNLSNKPIYTSLSHVSKQLDSDGNLVISGLASTTEEDRSGDIITEEAWKRPNALKNFNKNPILLFQHDRNRPIGKVTDHKIGPQGLEVTATITKEADPVVAKLIEDEVLRTFSIGFILRDAFYDDVNNKFYITELELLEVSVVTIPDNQSSMFSVSKQLEENLGKEEFIKFKSKSRARAEQPNDDQEIEDDLNMNQEQLQKLLDDAVSKSADSVLSSIEKKDKEREERKAAEARKHEEANELTETITKTVRDSVLEDVKKVTVEAVNSGAEEFAKFLKVELDGETKNVAQVVAENRETIKNLKEDLLAMQGNDIFRGSRRDSVGINGVSDKQKDTAVILAKALSNKDRKVELFQTEFGQELLKAAGFQADDSTTAVVGDHTVNDIDWETEFRTRIWSDIRRELVMEPMFRTIEMNTNYMRLPVNPDQGYASYVAIDNFKSANSTPAASVGNRLTEVTLTAHKLAAKDYIGYEETEDTILPIVPIIRDNLVRRMQKSSDRSVLRGVGATAADPVKGLAQYAADASNNTTTVSLASEQLTAQKLENARRQLGVFGIRPDEVAYIVNTQGYYDLLDDPDFRTRDKVGEGNATILTGEVGMVNGSRVVISDEFATPAAGQTAAVVANMRNFYMGNHRMMSFLTDEDIEEQKTILVVTRRFGTVEMESGGVATVEYVA